MYLCDVNWYLFSPSTAMLRDWPKMVDLQAARQTFGTLEQEMTESRVCLPSIRCNKRSESLTRWQSVTSNSGGYYNLSRWILAGFFFAFALPSNIIRNLLGHLGRQIEANEAFGLYSIWERMDATHPPGAGPANSVCHSHQLIFKIAQKAAPGSSQFTSCLGWRH